MIIINTSHVVTDGFLDVSGTESSDILDLSGDIAAAGDIQYRFSAYMAGKDLVVRGKASVEIHAECARCLNDVMMTLSVPDICIVCENVPEREVDITDNVREDLLLALPARILCSEDCKGLCPHCGTDLNKKKCTCSRKRDAALQPEQSPWSVLDQLDLKKEEKKTKVKKNEKQKTKVRRT